MAKSDPERVVREIKRHTRRKYGSEKFFNLKSVA